MASGASGMLMWRTGPPRGCDAVLRPRGKAMGGPHEAQVANRARKGGKRPRVSTQVHADAREGCHVACELAYGGPMG